MFRILVVQMFMERCLPLYICLWVGCCPIDGSPIGTLIHFSYEAVQLNTIAPLALYEGEALLFLCRLRNFFLTLTLTFNWHCRTLDHKIVASR